MLNRRDLLTYGLAILVSFIVHFGLWGGLTSAARNNPRQRNRAIEFAVIKPKPPPPPPMKPPDPDKPKPKPPPPVDVPLIKAPEPELPPPPNTSDGKVTSDKAKPVFGISMSSVVGPGSGSGFAVRVGNTLMKDPNEKYTPPSEVKAYKPVPLHTVSRQPLPSAGQCKGDNREYPREAKELRIEGRVQLDVEIRADGTVGAVSVVQGLGHGLDELAVTIVKRCQWRPADIGGTPVTTRIIYGVTFIIED